MVSLTSILLIQRSHIQFPTLNMIYKISKEKVPSLHKSMSQDIHKVGLFFKIAMFLGANLKTLM